MPSGHDFNRAKHTFIPLSTFHFELFESTLEGVIKIAIYRFTVNGISLLNYLAEDGIKWTRFDVEAPDTGRTLDGVMHRRRVASKVRLDITCRPLKDAEAMAVLSAIKPEFVTVRYIDPQDGSVTRTMYSNNIPTICATVNPDGTAFWKGLSFPLIER